MLAANYSTFFMLFVTTNHFNSDIEYWKCIDSHNKFSAVHNSHE